MHNTENEAFVISIETNIQLVRPDIKRGKFIMQEEQTMIQVHGLLGNRFGFFFKAVEILDLLL